MPHGKTIVVRDFVNKYMRLKHRPFRHAVAKLSFGVVMNVRAPNDAKTIAVRSAEALRQNFTELLEHGYEIFVSTGVECENGGGFQVELVSPRLFAVKIVGIDGRTAENKADCTADLRGFIYVRGYTFFDGSHMPETRYDKNAYVKSPILPFIERFMMFTPIEMLVRRPIDATNKNMLVYCHDRPVETHFALPGLLRLAEGHSIERDNIFTVDIRGEPDIVANGFSEDFLERHTSMFDVVVMPDCDGPWMAVVQMEVGLMSLESRMAFLKKLFDAVFSVVKPGGTLVVSKLHASHREFIGSNFSPDRVSNVDDLYDYRPGLADGTFAIRKQ
jgi:hypothetical protein